MTRSAIACCLLISMTSACVDHPDDVYGEDEAELLGSPDPTTDPIGPIDEAEGPNLLPVMIGGGCPIGGGGYGVFRVWNRGTVRSAPTTVAAKVTYRSGIYTSSNTVTFSIAAIDPGASAFVGVASGTSQTLRFKNYSSGGWTPIEWKVTVDPNGVVSEYNEHDNILVGSSYCH